MDLNTPKGMVEMEEVGGSIRESLNDNYVGIEETIKAGGEECEIKILYKTSEGGERLAVDSTWFHLTHSFMAILMEPKLVPKPLATRNRKLKIGYL